MNRKDNAIGSSMHQNRIGQSPNKIHKATKQLFSNKTEYPPNRSTMSATDENCDRGFLSFLAYVRGENADAQVNDPTLMEEDGVDRRAEVNVPRKHER